MKLSFRTFYWPGVSRRNPVRHRSARLRRRSDGLKEYGITYKDISLGGGKRISNNCDDAADLPKDGQIDMM